MKTTTIGVAVVGAGMAGQAHAFGYSNAAMANDLADCDIRRVAVVDADLDLARTVADRYGFEHGTDDLEAVLAEPAVDALSVALPNFAHADVLPRILASGKHLLAEKPIGRSLAEATALAEQARASTAVTGVGFSFRRLPGLAAVAAAVADGRIGSPHTVRGWYYADYAADPQAPLSWRYARQQAGAGALLDIGAHAVDALTYVAGPVATVRSAELRTVIATRPRPINTTVGHGGTASSDHGAVTNDDLATLTVDFASGALGTLLLSRIAHGVPNSLGVEVFGTNGHVRFDSLRAGEFEIFTAADTDPYGGPRTVFTGPQHPPFADVAAMPGTGVGTGYAEAFVAEIQEFIRCIRHGQPMSTNFDTAVAMMTVVEAAQQLAAADRNQSAD